MSDMTIRNMSEGEKVKCAQERLHKTIHEVLKLSDEVRSLIPGFRIAYMPEITEPRSYVHKPSVCFTVCGAKNVVLGKETYTYNSSQYLISSLDLPVLANIIEAPYIGMLLEIDLKTVSQLITDSHMPPVTNEKSACSIGTSSVTVPLVNAFRRLVELFFEPESIPILAPMIKREIFYRLLMGSQGTKLKQIAGNRNFQIGQIINWLKENFKKPLSVGDLARKAYMSTSSFHHHFKVLTTMSPLQYQKRLRLHEARRLMLSENYDVTTTAFEVGYESASQFSREYSRLFGAPPTKDIKALMAS